MPAVLRDHQHEISDVNGNGSLVFGTEDTGYLTIDRPSITPGEIRSATIARPQEDGAVFGRDFRGAKTYVFAIGVLTDELNEYGGMFGTEPESANLDALNLLEARWTHEKWRANPTDYAMLRSNEAGRTSRCYGRPGRWEEAAGILTQHGYTPVVADFSLIDDRWYDDVEDSIVVTPSSGAVPMAVGGFASTWVTVTFQGPVTNPSVTIAGAYSVGLTGTLTSTQSITVDPRPWARTVLRNDGVSLPGWMDGPKMKYMKVEPGTRNVTYTGTGASSATLRWRDARLRP